MRIAIAFLICASLATQAYASLVNRNTYCDFYANQAVKARKKAREWGCYDTGPVWNSNYYNHYNWCMGLSGDPRDAADKGADLRAARVSHCYCWYYAREAAKAAKENVSLGCGFTGARWIDNEIAHESWCRKLGRFPEDSRAANDEAQARIQGLQRCKIKQGAKTSPSEAGTTADPKAGPSLGRKRTFSGTWDTEMIPGGSFSATFTQQGNRVTGQFINGSLEGTLEGETILNFTVTFQSSVRGSGHLTLQGRRAFDGRFTLDSDPGRVRMWTGTRR